METRKNILEEIKTGFAMIGEPVLEVVFTRKGEVVITTADPDVWGFIASDKKTFVSMGSHPFDIGEIIFPKQKGGTL